MLYQDLLLSNRISRDLGLSGDTSFSLLNAIDEYRSGQALPKTNSEQVHPDSERIKAWLDTHSDQIKPITELFDLSRTSFSSLDSFKQYFDIDQGKSGKSQIEQITEKFASRLERAKFDWNVERNQLSFSN